MRSHTSVCGDSLCARRLADLSFGPVLRSLGEAAWQAILLDDPMTNASGKQSEGCPAKPKEGAGESQAAPQGVEGLWHVYFLRSCANPKKTYVGRTEDVRSRLAKHNRGGSPYTAKYKPWELIAMVSVPSEEKAIQLETYFKSGSGHAFAHKRLW